MYILLLEAIAYATSCVIELDCNLLLMRWTVALLHEEIICSISHLKNVCNDICSACPSIGSLKYKTHHVLDYCRPILPLDCRLIFHGRCRSMWRCEFWSTLNLLSHTQLHSGMLRWELVIYSSGGHMWLLDRNGVVVDMWIDIPWIWPIFTHGILLFYSIYIYFFYSSRYVFRFWCISE